jgi:hypothetical protein
MSCIICLNNDAIYAFNKCGHKLFCNTCSDASKLHQLKNCSFCRTQGDLIKIFDTIVNIDSESDTDTETETTKTTEDMIEIKKKDMIKKMYEYMKEQFEDVVKALTLQLDGYNSKIKTIRDDIITKKERIIELETFEQKHVQKSLNEVIEKNTKLHNELNLLEHNSIILDDKIKKSRNFIEEKTKTNEKLQSDINNMLNTDRELELTLRKIKRKQKLKKKQIVDIILKEYGYVIKNGKLCVQV